MSEIESALRASKSSVLLAVQARPGARTEGLRGIRGGRLRVDTRSPPEGGRANAAIEKLVAAAFELSRDEVRVVSGASSRHKELALSGIGLDRAKAILAELLAD